MIFFSSLLASLFCLSISSMFCCQAKTVYVSSSEGNDAYDGHSIEKPLKTIATALSKADTILLKSGDVFYVGSLTISKKVLSRYGKGSNPTICGYKRIIEPRWKKVGNNVWRIYLEEDNFTGIVIKGSSTSNNICAFHDYQNDLIHGRKVWHKEEMKEDWDFWQTSTLSKAKPDEYDNLYLYLEDNPNNKSLEFSIWDFALRADNATIDGVNFIGFGAGISAGTKTVIRNCRVDAIGGRIIQEGDSYVCYGNGIEFWVSGELDSRDGLVENCYVTRCYDCGITIQGSRGTTATPRNIYVRNNLIENCCQGWEEFLRNNKDVCYDHCYFENNIVLNSGNTTGFGYAKNRLKFCHILGNNIDGPRNMIIKNNVFIGGNYYCSGSYEGEYKSNVWEGNKCYLEYGNFLFHDYWSPRNAIRLDRLMGKRDNNDRVARYRRLTGDTTTQFTIKSAKVIQRMAKRKRNQFLKNHKY